MLSSPAMHQLRGVRPPDGDPPDSAGARALLGVGQVRKWASVWSLASVAQGGNAEVLPVAIIRARCCEILGDSAAGVKRDSGLFLLGMCSLLDVMLGRLMAAALADLPLAAEIRDALVGKPNVARSIRMR